MLYPRIIPCLTIDEYGDLIKTIKFNNDTRRYIGDVENAVRIFNEKKADEIIVLDIDASVKKLEPKYDLIEKIAFSCRMPLSYGGGIKNLDQAKKIINIGVEKIILSSVIFKDMNLIKEISNFCGSQSLAVCLDIFYDKEIKIFTHNGKIYQGDENIINLIEKIQNNGVGELIINSIDRDGTMNGFNLECIRNFFQKIRVPLTLIGGAGELEHFLDARKTIQVSGLASGSFFIYKSRKKGVLINYPDKAEMFK